jgi:Domain of unknown function (DUF1937)
VTETEIVYVAAPYSDPDPEVRIRRFEAVTRYAATLVAAGRIVYSPLTHSHPIDLVLIERGVSCDSDFWVTFDEAFMAICTEIHVLKLDGWERSSGVNREINYFARHHRLVIFVDPSEAA